MRWMDIKRLNREGANISLKRLVGGKEFVLPANDQRFAIAIPKEIMELSDIEQNPR